MRILFLAAVFAVVAGNATARESAQLSGIGILEVVVDQSSEYSDQCDPSETAFSARLADDSTALSRDRITEGFGSVRPDQPSITIRRGPSVDGPASIDRNEVGVLPENFRPAFVGIETLQAPEIQIDTDIAVFGCARMGAFHIVEILISTRGRIALYDLDFEATFEMSQGSEAVQMAYGFDDPSFGNTFRAERSNSGFESAFGFPFNRQHLGVLDLVVWVPSHNFSPVEIADADMTASFSLGLRLLMVDQGLNSN